MKILGIGVDIIENKRIKKSIKNDKFKNRVYSSRELKLSSLTINKVNFFSKRFAAKEAFSKALGTGIAKGINFNEIIINNMDSGKPHITLMGETKKKVGKIIKKKNNIFLTLSDDNPFAVASVIITI